MQVKPDVAPDLAGRPELAEREPNAAQYVSHTVPPVMVPGGRYAATVTMRNTGIDTWNPGGATPHLLGSQGPQDNSTWGLSRVPLTSSVRPGATATFRFTVTAPAAPGSYVFQWRMLQESVEWFGGATPATAIKVSPNAAQYVSHTVPPAMVPGGRYAATVTMRNTGPATWNPGGATPHRLGSQGPQDNGTWGFGRVPLPAPIPPGELAIFHFTVTAPAAPATYVFRWRMLQESVEWFGDFTPEVVINVSTGMEMHVLGAYSSGWPGGVGRLWHTVRLGDGSWLGFDDVEAQAGEKGTFTDIDCASIGGEFHVCGVAATGPFPFPSINLWHGVRGPNGSWTQQFLNVEAVASDPPGTFRWVGVAEVNGELHVCAFSDGYLYHTIRHADANWERFADVFAATSYPGPRAPRPIACAALGGELHVFMGSGGPLPHATRRANGSWSPFGDVKLLIGDPGTINDLACAGFAGVLHLCVVIGQGGRLLHTMRRVDGSWFPFGDVKAQAGDIGLFSRVACATDRAGGLHILGVTRDGRMWHTIRQPDGSWVPFVDVESRAGESGTFESIAVAGLFI